MNKIILFAEQEARVTDSNIKFFRIELTGGEEPQGCRCRRD